MSAATASLAAVVVCPTANCVPLVCPPAICVPLVCHQAICVLDLWSLVRPPANCVLDERSRHCSASSRPGAIPEPPMGRVLPLTLLPPIPGSSSRVPQKSPITSLATTVAPAMAARVASRPPCQPARRCGCHPLRRRIMTAAFDLLGGAERRTTRPRGRPTTSTATTSPVATRRSPRWRGIRA